MDYFCKAAGPQNRLELALALLGAYPEPIGARNLLNDSCAISHVGGSSTSRSALYL